MGTHVLGIKDMAGLCKPYAAYALVKALREEVGRADSLPHARHQRHQLRQRPSRVPMPASTSPTRRWPSMGGMTSQPCLNGIVAALRHTERDTGLDQVALDDLSRYWAAVRELYYPFEEGLKAPGADVYQHEMPGGQYTNLRQQAKSLGLESRWPDVCDAYADGQSLVGDIVKVTPSSKVVGDLALFLVTNKLTADDVMTPTQAAQFSAQRRGDDAGAARRTRRRMAEAVPGHRAASRPTPKPIVGRPGASMPPADFAAAAKEIQAKTRP